MSHDETRFKGHTKFLWTGYMSRFLMDPAFTIKSDDTTQ